MNKKKILIFTIIIIISILLTISSIHFSAKYIALSPLCYTDNKNLTENENYFIKKIVLEEIEKRYSLIENGNRLFIFIDTDFMNTVEKVKDGYIIRVQSHYTVQELEDCLFEIHITKDFTVTKFLLDA